MSDEAKKTILIVDDEADVSTYLRAFFEDNGFNAAVAENGKVGFEKAKEIQPALITLDITMPEESGVRMFRDLQAEPATAAIPVIMITGVSHEFKRFIETRRQVHPPAAYFEKPIDRDALLAKVTELLDSAASS
jgi:DNA-binding response OmpR family regulator